MTLAPRRHLVVWALLVPPTVVACWVLVPLASLDDVDAFDGFLPALVANCVAGAVCSLLAPAREMYALGTDPADGEASAERRSTSRGVVGALRLAPWLLVPQLGAMVVGWVLALSRGATPGGSYWGTVALVVLLLAPLALALGLLAGCITLVPLSLLPDAVARAVRGDLTGRARVWMLTLVADILPFAVTTTWLTGQGRRGLVPGVLMLLGAREPVAPEALAWARLTGVVLVVSLVLTVVDGLALGRRAKRQAAARDRARD